MKSAVSAKILVVALSFLMLVLGSMNCRPGSDPAAEQESKITLLCLDDNERSVFKDAKSTMFLMFLPLAHEDQEGRYQPGLLERWEHSDDYLDWTFHLREDVRWHDGTPVTSQDVKFTLELITDPNIMYEHRFFEEIMIVDDYTYRIKTDGPLNPLPYISWYGICPHHLLGSLDPAEFHEWEFWKQPVGNGPYRYVRHVEDTVVELEANPDHFRGVPKIKRVVLKFGSNPVTELRSGNVDAVSYLSPREVLQLAQDPRFNVFHEFLFQMPVSIGWNPHNPIFQDPSVRRAITLAINRKELHRVLNLPETTPVFDVPFQKGQHFRGELPEPLPYDPGQADKLLNEAGWVANTEGGLREKDGVKFQFSLLTVANDSMTAVYIQDQLRKVGIRMEVITLEIFHLVRRGRERDFDAILSKSNPLAYQELEGILYSPEFTRLIKQATLSPTVESFDHALKKLWPTFLEVVPFTLLYPYITFTVAHRRVRGLESPHRSYPGKFMEYLWLDQE